MKVTLIGNKNGVYIDPTNNNALVNYTKAVNAASVDFDGVNHLVVRKEDNGDLIIVQTGGYSSKRGLFTDLYS